VRVSIPRDVRDGRLAKKTFPQTLFMLTVGLGNSIEASEDDDIEDSGEMHEPFLNGKTSFLRNETR